MRYLQIWVFLFALYFKPYYFCSLKFDQMDANTMTTPTLAPSDSTVSTSTGKLVPIATFEVTHKLEYSKIINLLIVGTLIFTAGKLLLTLFAYILKIA